MSAPNVLLSRAWVAAWMSVLPLGNGLRFFPPPPATKDRMPFGSCTGVVTLLPEVPILVKTSLSWLWPETVTSTPLATIRSQSAPIAAYGECAPLVQRGRWNATRVHWAVLALRVSESHWYSGLPTPQPPGIGWLPFSTSAVHSVL